MERFKSAQEKMENVHRKDGNGVMKSWKRYARKDVKKGEKHAFRGSIFSSGVSGGSPGPGGEGFGAPA